MFKFEKKIELSEIEDVWGFTASQRFINKFSELDLSYTEISNEQRDEAILKIIETLDSDLSKSGPHRVSDWEKGWGENLRDYLESKELKDSVPKYFGKIPYIRWKQRWILPKNKDMEYQLLALIIEFIVDKYLGENDSIYEFGCGTGHNLIRIREALPYSYLHGLDWVESSQELINMISLNTSDKLLEASKFDFFDPNTHFSLRENSVALTIASLEQTGRDFKKFVDYLIGQKPRLVIHIEPLWEPLDDKNLLDNLSVRYFRKRNYLDGLILYLREKQVEGKLELIDLKRTFVGSFFIDGYSIAVWRPTEI